MLLKKLKIKLETIMIKTLVFRKHNKRLSYLYFMMSAKYKSQISKNIIKISNAL